MKLSTSFICSKIKKKFKIEKHWNTTKSIAHTLFQASRIGIVIEFLKYTSLNIFTFHNLF